MTDNNQEGKTEVDGMTVAQPRVGTDTSAAGLSPYEQMKARAEFDAAEAQLVIQRKDGTRFFAFADGDFVDELKPYYERNTEVQAEVRAWVARVKKIAKDNQTVYLSRVSTRAFRLSGTHPVGCAKPFQIL